MDPNERLTCDQLLEHVYFDKRFTESFAADTAQAAYDLQQVTIIIMYCYAIYISYT